MKNVYKNGLLIQCKSWWENNCSITNESACNKECIDYRWLAPLVDDGGKGEKCLGGRHYTSGSQPEG